MRFLADSPSIPDALLVARDEGRVIFFCGAGVSRARAGLPDFFELAQRVTDTLGVTSDNPAKRLIEEAREIESRTGLIGLISADRVFGLLERDFLVKDIQAAVAKALKPSPSADLSAHRIMLELARGPDGKVRLVTTNFDLLFESCDSALRSSRPPRLPDPRHLEDFEGIIHLHGCVDSHYMGSEGDGFVLSSAEFGRAYLSDGWATQFIRSILEGYFVVFVGYTADDPPVQYLLEALNRSVDIRASVYAFQSGSTSDAQARWRHKGVQPIAYNQEENHKALWNTLAEWTIRAQNPEAWYGKTIELARKGPESLLSDERGQIAHIVSIPEGARKIASSDPPPPADWLCVFDPLTRYSKPGHLWRSGTRGPDFDPFSAYGLDSDPVPPKIAPDDFYAKREIPENAWDCFAVTRLDRQNLGDDSFAYLRGHWATHVPRLPARLAHLGVWISKVSNQPAAVWWASGQVGIHPNIQFDIRFHLERVKATCSPEIRRAWRYIFEVWETQKNNFNRDWYELKAFIDVDGWTIAAVRELAQTYRPYLTAKRPWNRPKPPENRSDVDMRDIVHLDVEYPSLYNEVNVPDEYIATAVREFRKNLEYAVSLETELGGHGLSLLCPIEPDPALQGTSSGRAHGISGALLFYVSLFKRLVETDLKAAKQEYLAWPIDDETVFARLRIWICGDQRVLLVAEAGDLICGLNDRVFWDSRCQRDLLLVLEKRWSDFSATAKAQLGRRLLDGPSRWDGEEEIEYVERRARTSLNRIHWLQSRGCEFDFDLDTESAKLRELAPNWRSEYAQNTASSMEPRGGWVRTDSEFSALLKVPLVDVLNKAAELRGRTGEMFVERNPFAGLASQRPVRAFSALTVSAKRDVYPKWAWATFLNSESRKSDKPRFSALIAERISILPAGVLAELIDPVSDWILTSSKVLLTEFPAQFDRVWEIMISVLKSNPDCGRSSVVRGNKEPDWAGEALNAPVGKLAQALMKDPQPEGIGPGKGFPLRWISRVDELLSLEGDLRRYGLVLFAFHLNWVFAIDAAWTEKNLISVLAEEGQDQSALWAGFFWGAKLPNQALYMRLKPFLLRLARQKSIAPRNHSDVLAAILLAGWGTVDSTTGERFVTCAEMREVLINADDDFRSHVLWQLERWSSEAQEGDGNWLKQLPVFLTEVWPRQKSAKTSRITARLCELAFSDAAAFQERVEIILPLVTKIDQEARHHLVRLEENIVDQYPEKTLALLSAILPDDTAVWPYGIETVLERIANSDPSLLRDPRLVELKRRWNAR